MRSHSARSMPDCATVRQASRPEALCRTPHQVVQVLQRHAVASLQQRPKVVVDQRRRRLPEAALTQTPRAVLGRHLHPDLGARVRPRHLSVQSGELRVLVDRQRPPSVRVPVRPPRLRLRRRPRYVQLNRPDLFDLHSVVLTIADYRPHSETPPPSPGLSADRCRIPRVSSQPTPSAECEAFRWNRRRTAPPRPGPCARRRSAQVLGPACPAPTASTAFSAHAPRTGASATVCLSQETAS